MESALENQDPFELFRAWYEEASASPLLLPGAMTLATVGRTGMPAARIVLLSSFDLRGFVFHTNYDSGKGLELATRPGAALVFWWEPLNRQVRIEGEVARTTPEESDAYFANRPRASQLSSWASDQSRPLAARETLDVRMREVEARYEGRAVPRPPHWGGYRVNPLAFEFWTGRDDRLHERLRFDRTPEGWAGTRLYP